MRLHVSLVRSEEAATAVEYAVMLGAILVVCIAAIAAVGDQTALMYGNIQSEMESHGIN